MLTLVVENQSHGTFADLRGKLVRRLAHDAPSYSRVGASGKPGAVHFAEALDDTLDDYADKLDKLRTIDFGPKTAVTEGAVIKLSGRYFVVAVSTDKFVCHGRELMGISTMAPIFEVIDGAQAGETVQFNGRELKVEAVS